MKKQKKLELKKDPKLLSLQFEEMKSFKGGDMVWSDEFQSYLIDEVTIYGGDILPYLNLVYVNSHDNEISTIFEAALNTVGIVWNGFVWVYNRL